MPKRWRNTLMRNLKKKVIKYYTILKLCVILIIGRDWMNRVLVEDISFN